MKVLERRKSMQTVGRFAVAALTTVLLFAASMAHAAIDGLDGNMTGNTFNLNASAGFISMPDGASIYSWGYGTGGLMQLPGPTLIVSQGATVTINLTNALPVAAGNTSIVIPGVEVAAIGGVTGLLTQEAQPGGTVSYSFTANRPGTYLYHSGTRADLQVEMGLYGAIVVLPTSVPAGCTKGPFSRAASAYGVAGTCYDREYLFVLSEMQIEIHQAVELQSYGTGPIQVATEPYQPEYWMINGRSAPATMEPPNTGVMPHQPYNSNPHMHPGEKVLLRIIGAGRQQHSFHTHGNHVRVLARDGQLLLTNSAAPALEGKLEFSVPSVPGQTVDGIFEWTGKNLGWDVYGHRAGDGSSCTPDASGYHSVAAAPNYREWCADHNRALPVTLPNPNVLMNGGWYAGSPFLGDLVQLPPGQGGLNPNAGFVYMWHSHVERELTNGNIFPGGLMTMLIVEPPSADINEEQ